MQIEKWSEAQDFIFDLHHEMDTLDVGVYTGPYDGWYASLSDYVDTLLAAVLEDSKHVHILSGVPATETCAALAAAAKSYEPNSIALDIDAAIRMESLAVKEKWDALNKS